MINDPHSAQIIWVHCYTEILYFVALLPSRSAIATHDISLYTKFRRFFKKFHTNYGLPTYQILDFEAFVAARSALNLTKELSRLAVTNNSEIEHPEHLTLNFGPETLEAFHAILGKTDFQGDITSSSRWDGHHELLEFLEREASVQYDDYLQQEETGRTTTNRNLSVGNSHISVTQSDRTSGFKEIGAFRKTPRTTRATQGNDATAGLEPRLRAKAAEIRTSIQKIVAKRRPREEALEVTSAVRRPELGRGKHRPADDNNEDYDEHETQDGGQKGKPRRSWTRGELEIMFKVCNAFIAKRSRGFLAIDKSTHTQLFTQIATAVNRYRRETGLSGPDRSRDAAASKWTRPRDKEIRELRERISVYQDWEADTSPNKPREPPSDPKVGIIYDKLATA